MSELTVQFKFDVGDIVYSETAMEDWRNKLSYPKSMIVAERVAKQCCGGVQLYYYVSNNGSPVLYPEAALALASEVREELKSARKQTWATFKKADNDASTALLPRVRILPAAPSALPPRGEFPHREGGR